MALHLLIVLLAFLTLVVGCASEQAKQAVSEKPRPGDEVFDFCTPPSIFRRDTPQVPDYDYPEILIRGDWRFEQYIQWSPDDSRILFNGPIPGHDQRDWPVDLHSVDPGGDWLHDIVNAPHKFSDQGGGRPMIYFDISPDGSRVTYSTCAYTEVEKEQVDYANWGGSRTYKVEADSLGVSDSEQKEGPRSWIYDYEIVVTDIDGKNVKRLTENILFDNFPTWSPDGTKVAFITKTKTWRGSNFTGRGWAGFTRDFTNHNLTIHALSTGRSKELALPPNHSVARFPLAWSPDGDRIAFVGWSYHSDAPVERVSVWTIRPDGTGLARITDAASGPAWSPDGERIAVAVPVDEGDVALYTFAADGSDPVLLSKNLSDPWRSRLAGPWMGNLSWSPDSSAILFKSLGYIAPLDGSPPTDFGLSEETMDSVWSPDGSRIAVRTRRDFTNTAWDAAEFTTLVYVMDRDSTNLRALVEGYSKKVVRLAE